MLNGLSFTVPAGTVVGLLGPNGAGKSTAMRVLLGLQRPTDGHARILGHEAGSPGFRDVTRKVGTIIESPPLYKNASALQNLRIRAASIDVSMRDEDLKEILNRVGLAERADDQTGSFSLSAAQLEHFTYGALTQDLSNGITGTGETHNGLVVALLGSIAWCALIIAPGWIRYLRSDLK